MSSLILQLLIFINLIDTQEVNCNGNCNCPSSPSGTTCTLNCDNQDACKGSTLNCRTGDPCTINCAEKASCAAGTTINAGTSTDVSVICSGGKGDACKDNIDITCGTGACILVCAGHQTNCENFGDIDVSNSKSFQCVGSECPNNIPDPFTAAPTTTSPTTAIPTTTSPTTISPSTISPTTMSPSTISPTTAIPTTRTPSTLLPTTTIPTTAIPTTAIPTTASPITSLPTTMSPITRSPTTVIPTTAILTTAIPTTASPTTMSPITSIPTTLSPTTVIPTTAIPTTAIPTTTVIPTISTSTVSPTTIEVTASIKTTIIKSTTTELIHIHSTKNLIDENLKTKTSDTNTMFEYILYFGLAIVCCGICCLCLLVIRSNGKGLTNGTRLRIESLSEINKSKLTKLQIKTSVSLKKCNSIILNKNPLNEINNPSIQLAEYIHHDNTKIEHVEKDIQIVCKDTEGGMINNEIRAAQKIKLWLLSEVGLPQYYNTFIENGYDTFNMIEAMEDQSCLTEIGIQLKEHQNKLWIEIEKLKLHTATRPMRHEGLMNIHIIDNNNKDDELYQEIKHKPTLNGTLNTINAGDHDGNAEGI